MATESPIAPPTDIAHLQTLQPKFRAQVAAVLSFVVVALALIGFVKTGPGRFFYAGLGILTAALLIARYHKESALVREHQTTVGVVTESRVRWKRMPYMWSGTPYIKYSFRAFDGITYMGEAVADLQAGTQITVLYRTSNPGSNLLLRSFIFYSFEGIL